VGGANITQLSLYLSILHIFCPFECSRTRHESRTTFNFDLPARLILHVIKIGRSTRAGQSDRNGKLPLGNCWHGHLSDINLPFVYFPTKLAHLRGWHTVWSAPFHMRHWYDVRFVCK
jgi:hypothetical protein